MAYCNAVQRYINGLSYNYTGLQYYEVQKHKPINRLIEVRSCLMRLKELCDEHASFSHIAPCARRQASQPDLLCKQLSKVICAYGLPIKCLEASIVGIHLTSGVPEVSLHTFCAKTVTNPLQQSI